MTPGVFICSTATYLEPAAALKAAAARGSAAAAATKKLGGHNSDYVSHNSLLDRVTHALHSREYTYTHPGKLVHV